jgi:hypothetical protein
MSTIPTYTQDDVESLLSKMALERAKLIAAAEGLRGDDADRVLVDAVGEEQWTAKEQLAHLMEMERSYVAWCRVGLVEIGADVSGVRGAPVNIPIEDAPGHTVRELLDELIEERERTNHFIRSLLVEQFSNTAVTPGFGELTVMQFLRSFYRHDRQHTAQIEGRQSDYQPNFQSGIEPNQRTMRIELVANRQKEEQYQ